MTAPTDPASTPEGAKSSNFLRQIIDRDLEARKHLWNGLERLGHEGRIRFLGSLCGTVKGPGGVGAKVTAPPATVGEAYMDVMMWSVGFGGCMFRACEAMERALRKRG